MGQPILRASDIKKEYILGQIGGTTLRDELQRKHAKLHGKEDPTKIIGERDYKSGERFMALDGISFDVQPGERVGIIGHNGAGKSTLLKLISRVTAPSSGEIGLNGRVTSMLEVGTGFHAELTGRENIYMNGAILGMTKKEIDSKIEEIIDFSECRRFIDTPVKRYSSGMYVKLAFSVAAHLDSEIIIMDEVLAVGDMAFQKKCLDKMNNVSRNEGKTILYVSHNMNTIRELCDRVIVLSHGKIIFDGGVEEGINTYLANMDSDDSRIEYEKRPRHILDDNRMISDMVAEYADREKNVFSVGEPLKIHFNWKNLEDIYSLSLRVELRRADRSEIGTAFIYDFYSGKAGESADAVVSVDVSLLVPGTYATTYTFFGKDQYGSNSNVFCAKGLNFRIADEGFEIVWDNIWGNVRFPNIKLEG